MYLLGASPVFHARAGLGDRAVAVLAPSQLKEDRRLRSVRAGGARRLAWAEVCPAGGRARAYQRWRRGFSEASRLSLQPVIVSLCILVPGLMPSVRGCRSYGVADVVVGVVGACACWEPGCTQCKRRWHVAPKCGPRVRHWAPKCQGKVRHWSCTGH